MNTYDAGKHPRGQAGNAGQFRNKSWSDPEAALTASTEPVLTPDAIAESIVFAKYTPHDDQTAEDVLWGALVDRAVDADDIMSLIRAGVTAAREVPAAPAFKSEGEPEVALTDNSASFPAIVDLDTWEPGEDVDADASIRDELSLYRAAATSTGRPISPPRGELVNAPESLTIGMYVTVSGGSTGRIVDCVLDAGVAWWVVKLGTGIICRVRSSHLTPRAYDLGEVGIRF